MTNDPVDLNVFFAQMRSQLRGAVLEITQMAQDSTEPNAQALAATLQDTLALDAFDGYVFEILKAYGCSAMSVPADEQESRTVLRQALAAYPSFAWAQQAYREGVNLDEINEALADDRPAKDQALARLRRWLDLEAV